MNTHRHPCLSISILPVLALLTIAPAVVAENSAKEPWLFSDAYAIPKHTTSEGSGYFAIVEGHNGLIYIGAAKYHANAYLVEFNPKTKEMRVVVDAQKEIGTDATGFAAQAKFHTRNNVGRSGKIYMGTKQGYPTGDEKRLAYPGGYPMVYDPKTETTRVYRIPIPHQGISSITPDELRGVAYISTCSDERNPTESSHFLQLDLVTGKYRHFLDCEHMYAFIVVDSLGRAYHPILGGDIARYDPRTDRFERLKHLVDGHPPTPESYLADPLSHPINWELSPDRKTLYSVAMSNNALFAYDLRADGEKFNGYTVGELITHAEATDCRAMCVAPDGVVWSGIAATFKDRGQLMTLASHDPRTGESRYHGPIAVRDKNFTEWEGPWHHGFHEVDGQWVPRYVVMGICAGSDGSVYVLTLYPLTLHVISPEEIKRKTVVQSKRPRVAAIVTAYYHNSHADVIASRLMQTDSLIYTGKTPQMDLVSLYVDQPQRGEKGIGIAKKHDVPLYDTVEEALTLGTGELAVDGVLLIAEHGTYPSSESGQIMYPKRRLFSEIVKVFDKSGRVVPVFNDKHISDNWPDAKWIYDQKERLNIPMMAGSSLVTLWRRPPADLERDAPIKEVIAMNHGPIETYGYHALEMVQCIVERRKGGESGIASAQCLVGDEVWDALSRADPEVLDAALDALENSPTRESLPERGKDQTLFVLNYKDGLRVYVLTHPHSVNGWTVAWRNEATKKIKSTLFWTQEARPFQHFGYLVDNIEKMILTGKPTYPMERTLLVSGVLNALMISRTQENRLVKTPYLDVEYQSDFDWQKPPPPPPGRPIPAQ